MKNKLEILLEEHWSKIDSEIKIETIQNLLIRPDLNDHSDESLICLIDTEVYQMSIPFFD